MLKMENSGPSLFVPLPDAGKSTVQPRAKNSAQRHTIR